MEGSYNEESQEVEVIFKKEISNVEITIYKEDAICEIAQEKKVTKEDYKSYLLATYGAGEYTICVKVDGVVIVYETIICNS